MKTSVMIKLFIHHYARNISYIHQNISRILNTNNFIKFTVGVEICSLHQGQHVAGINTSCVTLIR